MPRCCSWAPRKKLPPPMTTATCTPWRTTSAIWRATCATTSGSRPTCPPPNISPPSLSSTREYLGRFDRSPPSGGTACMPLVPVGCGSIIRLLVPERHPGDHTQDGNPILPYGRSPGGNCAPNVKPGRKLCRYFAVAARSPSNLIPVGCAVGPAKQRRRGQGRPVEDVASVAHDFARRPPAATSPLSLTSDDPAGATASKLTVEGRYKRGQKL